MILTECLFLCNKFLLQSLEGWLSSVADCETLQTVLWPQEQWLFTCRRPEGRNFWLPPSLMAVKCCGGRFVSYRFVPGQVGGWMPWSGSRYIPAINVATCLGSIWRRHPASEALAFGTASFTAAELVRMYLNRLSVSAGLCWSSYWKVEKKLVRFQVLTATCMKMTVFWSPWWWKQ